MLSKMPLEDSTPDPVLADNDQALTQWLMFDAGGVLDGATPLSRQQILAGQSYGYIPQGRTVYELGDEDLAWSSEGDVIDQLNPEAEDQRVLKNGKMILKMLGWMCQQRLSNGQPKYKIALHSSNDPTALYRDLKRLRDASERYHLRQLKIDYSAILTSPTVKVKAEGGQAIEIRAAIDEASFTPVPYDVAETTELGEVSRVRLKDINVITTEAYGLSDLNLRIWTQKRDLRCAIEKGAMTSQEVSEHSGIIFDDGDCFRPDMRSQPDLTGNSHYSVYKINNDVYGVFDPDECSLYSAIERVFLAAGGSLECLEEDLAAYRGAMTRKNQNHSIQSFITQSILGAVVLIGVSGLIASFGFGLTLASINSNLASVSSLKILGLGEFSSSLVMAMGGLIGLGLCAVLSLYVGRAIFSGMRCCFNLKQSATQEQGQAVASRVQTAAASNSISGEQAQPVASRVQTAAASNSTSKEQAQPVASRG